MEKRLALFSIAPENGAGILGGVRPQEGRRGPSATTHLLEVTRTLSVVIILKTKGGSLSPDPDKKITGKDCCLGTELERKQNQLLCLFQL